MFFIFYLITIVLSIAFCIVAFLLISAGDLNQFIKIYGLRQRASILPVISRFGDVIATPQDLDTQLDDLKAKLKKKYNELEVLKFKVEVRRENADHVDMLQKDLFELEGGLVRVQNECGHLQEKIDYFRRIQTRVLEDVAPGKGQKGDADWLARSRTIL